MHSGNDPPNRGGKGPHFASAAAIACLHVKGGARCGTGRTQITERQENFAEVKTYKNENRSTIRVC
jgi:hypothetical protein